MSQVDFPYGVDARGRTASTSEDEHVRDLVEQVLFTAPGERVNRPTFGSGTATLVFAPNSDALAAAQQQIIQASLQMWLSDVIRVQSVDVSAPDATLVVTITYTILATRQQQTQQIAYGGTTT